MSVARIRRSDRAFTLVELMVVVLIIGILLAIAIPTFLGARSRAQDSVAKSSLRIALTAASVEEYDVDAAGMAKVESALAYVDADAASAGPKSVSVGRVGDSWSQAALSDSGSCFYVHLALDDPQPVWGRSADSSNCSAKNWVDGVGNIDTGGGGGGGGGGGPAPGSFADRVLATPDLLAFWQLDEVSGNVAVDSGPRGTTASTRTHRRSLSPERSRVVPRSRFRGPTTRSWPCRACPSTPRSG